MILAYLELSSIRIIAWFASTIIASSWGFVAFASVWSKKLTERGAYYSMLGGFFGYLISKCLKEFLDMPFENIFHPFFVGVFVSIVFGIIGSYGQVKTEEETSFQNNLHLTPKSEILARDYKIDRMYGYVLIVSGVLITFLLIKYWALPYNEAIGVNVLAWLE